MRNKQVSTKMRRYNIKKNVLYILCNHFVSYLPENEWLRCFLDFPMECVNKHPQCHCCEKCRIVLSSTNTNGVGSSLGKFWHLLGWSNILLPMAHYHVRDGSSVLYNTYRSIYLKSLLIWLLFSDYT